jgi:hypothetical protein
MSCAGTLPMDGTASPLSRLQMLETILNCLHDAVEVRDRTGALVYANKAALQSREAIESPSLLVCSAALDNSGLLSSATFHNKSLLQAEQQSTEEELSATNVVRTDELVLTVHSPTSPLDNPAIRFMCDAVPHPFCSCSRDVSPSCCYNCKVAPSQYGVAMPNFGMRMFAGRRRIHQPRISSCYGGNEQPGVRVEMVGAGSQGGCHTSK